MLEIKVNRGFLYVNGKKFGVNTKLRYNPKLNSFNLKEKETLPFIKKLSREEKTIKLKQLKASLKHYKEIIEEQKFILSKEDIDIRIIAKVAEIEAKIELIKE